MYTTNSLRVTHPRLGSSGAQGVEGLKGGRLINCLSGLLGNSVPGAFLHFRFTALTGN